MNAVASPDQALIGALGQYIIESAYDRRRWDGEGDAVGEYGGYRLFWRVTGSSMGDGETGYRHQRYFETEDAPYRVERIIPGGRSLDQWRALRWSHTCDACGKVIRGRKPCEARCGECRSNYANDMSRELESMVCDSTLEAAKLQAEEDGEGFATATVDGFAFTFKAEPTVCEITQATGFCVEETWMVEEVDG